MTPKHFDHSADLEALRDVPAERLEQLPIIGALGSSGKGEAPADAEADEAGSDSREGPERGAGGGPEPGENDPPGTV